MTVYEALDIVSQGFADSDEGLTAVKTIADYRACFSMRLNAQRTCASR